MAAEGQVSTRLVDESDQCGFWVSSPPRSWRWSRQGRSGPRETGWMLISSARAAVQRRRRPVHSRCWPWALT